MALFTRDNSVRFKIEDTVYGGRGYLCTFRYTSDNNPMALFPGKRMQLSDGKMYVILSVEYDGGYIVKGQCIIQLV